MFVNYDGSVIEFIKELVEKYTSNNEFLFLYVFLGCVFVAFFTNKKLRAIFSWPIVLFFAIIFNPITLALLNKLGLMSTGRFYRFLWVLPIPITIAFLICYFITQFKSKVVIVISTIAVSVVLIMCGNVNNTKEKFYCLDNIYKIPNNVIEMSEVIHNDYEGENPVLYYDDWIMMFYRTYDPAVISYRTRGESVDTADMSYDEMLQAYENDEDRKLLERVIIYNNKEMISTKQFKVYIDEIDYIICEENNINRGYYDEAGLEYMGTFDGYELYKNIK